MVAGRSGPPHLEAERAPCAPDGERRELLGTYEAQKRQVVFRLLERSGLPSVVR